jgi:hypothetical protein
VKIEIGKDKYVHAIICRQEDPQSGGILLMLQHFQAGVTLQDPLEFGFDSYIGCFKREFEARIAESSKKP